MLGCIGIVSAGSMGSAIGKTLAAKGTRVVVALEQRSRQTADRAARAGLVDVGTVTELVGQSDLVLSIVPPARAAEVAQHLADAMAETGHHPVVLDANAISPARAKLIARTIEESGGQYLDGGIIGGPPRDMGRTDLFVSGPHAGAVVEDLTTNELVVTDLGEDPTAASTLKMCHAAWTKCSSALLITVRSAACRYGVDSALCDLWAQTQPDLLARSEGEGRVADRAWRWVDEMLEIANTLDDAELPDGAALAAAAVYERLAGFKDVPSAPSLDAVVAAVLAR